MSQKLSIYGRDTLYKTKVQSILEEIVDEEEGPFQCYRCGENYDLLNEIKGQQILEGNCGVFHSQKISEKTSLISALAYGPKFSKHLPMNAHECSPLLGVFYL